MRAIPDIVDQPAPITDDATLVRRARAGDEDAFRAIFDRHVGAVRRFAIARTDAANVDDVVVEAFAEFWRTIDRFDTGQPLRPWLLGIASVRARRHATREWKRARASDRSVRLGRADDDGDELDDAIIDPQIVAALLRLGDGEREILVLVAVGDMSVADAARAVGITPTTARVRLHRARRAMQRELDGKDAP